MFGFVSTTRAVKQRVQTLVQLNLELAKLEGKQKATSLGLQAVSRSAQRSSSSTGSGSRSRPRRPA